MNIAVLGAGIIGATLARKWLAAGHAVMFGSRTPDKPELRELVASLGPQASAGNTEAAIAFGDAVVFAILGRGMVDMIAAQAGALAGKVVVDSTNAIGGPSMNNNAAFAQHAPTARVYRAFNSLGVENFENPVFDGTPADHFFCGPDGDGRAIVEALIAGVGLRPIYIGGPEQADTLDAMTRLWFALVRGQGMPRHMAFKLLGRQALAG